MKRSSLTEYGVDSRLYATQKLALDLSKHFITINTEAAGIHELYTKAQSLYELFRFTDCIETLNELLKLNNSHKDAYFLKALAYRKIDKFQNALQNLDRCLKLDSKNYQYHYNKGLNLEDLGLFDKAVDSYKKATDLNSSFAESFFRLGCLHYELKKYNEAVEYFDRAYKLDHYNEEALFNWAVAKFYIQEYKDSLTGFDAIIAQYPLYTEAFVYKAQCLEKLNKIKEAFACLNQFCQAWEKKKFPDVMEPKRVATMIMEPKFDEGFNNVTYSIKEVQDVLSKENSLLSDEDERENIREKMNDDNEALLWNSSKNDHFNSNFDEDFPQEVNLMRIRYSLILKEYNRALSIVEAALIKHQSYSEGYFYKAVILNKMGRKYEVLEAITKAITVNPNNYFYYCFRGSVHFFNSKEKCLNDFQKASKILTSKFENLYLDNETLRTLNSYFLRDVKGYIPITTQIINYFDYLEKSIASFEKIYPNEIARIDSIVKDHELYHDKTYHLLNKIYDIKIGSEDREDFQLELNNTEHKLSHMIRKYILIIPLIENNYNGQTLIEKLQNYKRNDSQYFEYISTFYSLLINFMKSFTDFKSMKQMSIIELEGDVKIQNILDDEYKNIDNFSEICKIIIETATFENGFLNYEKRKSFIDVFKKKSLSMNETVLGFTFAKIGVLIMSNEAKALDVQKAKLSTKHKQAWDIFKKYWKKNKIAVNTKKLFGTKQKQLALIDAVLLAEYISHFTDDFISSLDPLEDQLVYTVLSEKHVNNFLENSEGKFKKSFFGSLLS